MSVADSTHRQALAAGDVIDGMTIVAARARGGFAHIYEARRDDARRVALKVLLPHVASQRGFSARLELEAAALSAFVHPHVVEILGCGTSRGQPYIAMEWLEGRSLAEHIALRGALPAPLTLEIFEQVCSAVSAAHDAGIVHRDIKAENIVLLDGARVHAKLVDFGIAKLLRPVGPGITTSRQIIGTPVAMAPEQLLGGTVDERTDVYALGALLYHCLTGHPPFWGRNIVEIEELHLAGEPPRASEVVASMPAIDAVILRAMAKGKAARHASVAAFLADLRDALASRPTERRGAVVYVEAACGDDDGDIDALDRAMLDATQILRDAGFEILAEASNAILAGAALPGAGEELLRRALAAASSITRPRMRIEICAAVDVLVGARSELGPATLAGVHAGVVVTAGVLELVPELAVEPLHERPGRYRVV